MFIHIAVSVMSFRVLIVDPLPDWLATGNYITIQLKIKDYLHVTIGNAGVRSCVLRGSLWCLSAAVLPAGLEINSKRSKSRRQ